MAGGNNVVARFCCLAVVLSSCLLPVDSDSSACPLVHTEYSRSEGTVHCYGLGGIRTGLQTGTGPAAGGNSSLSAAGCLKCPTTQSKDPWSGVWKPKDPCLDCSGVEPLVLPGFTTPLVRTEGQILVFQCSTAEACPGGYSLAAARNFSDLADQKVSLSYSVDTLYTNRVLQTGVDGALIH